MCDGVLNRPVHKANHYYLSQKTDKNSLTKKTKHFAQKMEFFIKDFFSKCEQTADLVIFTEEILNGKIAFLCSAGDLFAK